MQDFISPEERMNNLMNHVTHTCRICCLAHSEWEEARDCCFIKTRTITDKDVTKLLLLARRRV